MTEEPSGEWLCPKCSLKSTKEAEIQKQRPEAMMSVIAKLGKTATSDLNDTLSRENQSGQIITDRAKIRAQKGIAIRKVPPKKERPKWIGWVEMTSEDEDDHRQSIFASQEAVIVAEEKRMEARAIKSKERPTRSRTVKETAKIAAGAKKEAGTESDEEGIDQEDPTRKADSRPPFHNHHLLAPIPSQPKQPPKNATNKSNPPLNPSPKTPNALPPALSSQSAPFPPRPVPSSNPGNPSTITVQDPSDLPLTITAQHPSDVPSTPPLSGAATMVIDTEEPGRAASPIITSIAPDGSSSVDYWSYRTNTWCTIPLSAMRSTLPRLQ